MDNKTEGRGFLSDGYTAFKWTVDVMSSWVDGDFTIFGVDGCVSLRFVKEQDIEDVGRLISALEEFRAEYLNRQEEQEE